jgi:hypothetical protein
MSLVVPDPPEESVEALRTTLGQLAARGQFSDRRLERVRPEQVTATVAHQVFTLGVADLIDERRDERGLAAARPTAWRYLIEADRQVVAAAETVSGDKDRPHVFSQLNHGPFVTGTMQALGVAERYAVDSDVELRALHVPALYVLALWLQPVGSSTWDTATLIPVSPAPPGIEANRPYRAAELLEILVARARDIPVLAADDLRGA